MKEVNFIVLLLSAFILFSCAGDQSKSDQNITEAETKTNDRSIESKKPETTKPPSDLSRLNIRGSIKTIIETDFRTSSKQSKNQKSDALSKRVITFSEEGYQLLQSNLNPDGSLKEDAAYKYDETGRKIEYQCNVTEGNFSYKSTFIYDENGNISEEIAKYSDGSLYYKSTFSYDDKGNQTEYTLYNLVGNVIKRITFKYDDLKRVIEENTLKPDGTLTTRYTYKYDNNGNKIEHAAYNPDNTLKGILTFKYEYDSSGNWAKKTTFKNDKPIEITERVIELY